MAPPRMWLWLAPVFSIQSHNVQKYPDHLDKAAELAVSSLHNALLLIVAFLVRTPNGYKMAGHDCQSSSLEIPLIRSQNDIPNPEVKYSARDTTGGRIALFT
ncbi:Pyridoxal kinase [Forsythia ovata]|uniref:Pyridoxal kinase n=1 Tax=Forsythia ovata TaxID=205694 RepID=A0ABD1US37_9LAMI